MVDLRVDLDAVRELGSSLTVVAAEFETANANTHHNYYVHTGNHHVLVHNAGGHGGAPRVWTSTDNHVADLANKIESAFPGRIQAVNVQIPMRNGLLREVDIQLDTLLIQVKEGKARGLIGQIRKTIETTGIDAIGYAPDMLRGSMAEAERQGVRIFQTADDVINIL